MQLAPDEGEDDDDAVCSAADAFDSVDHDADANEGDQTGEGGDAVDDEDEDADLGSHSLL